MNIIKYFSHGSEDSVDKDIVYIVDKMPSFTDCQAFCSLQDENRNIAVIKDRHIVECFKGSLDELNNSLGFTYLLHYQKYPLDLVPVKRDIKLKHFRVVKTILTMFTRTKQRIEIKEALRSNNINVMVEMLKNIDWNFNTFNKKRLSNVEIFKILAFQIGQYISLKNDIEIYTKGLIVLYMPELESLIYRLDEPFNKKLEIIKDKINEMEEI